jgi:hypothetical protein
MGSGLALSPKVAAALVGLSEATLRQARVSTGRSARPDLLTPPFTRLANGRIMYSLADLVAWAERMHRRVRWEALPASVALPAVALHESAGVPLPEALAGRGYTLSRLASRYGKA